MYSTSTLLNALLPQCKSRWLGMMESAGLYSSHRKGVWVAVSTTGSPTPYDSPTQFKASPPTNSNHHNHRAYKRQADEVLKASTGLNDRQKMTASFLVTASS
ncbi:hypothetical protein [Streptomyces atratus]|uniref:hypothetical protein n=1 Tax=Streptomyces atratus TaxID=1893 RepID=UPI0033C4FF20